MQKVKSPCKDCEDRVLGCHSTCPKYIEFVEVNREFYKEVHKQKSINNYIDTFNVQNVNKAKRRRGIK